MRENLYLIGFMGCGKSTVGRILSSRLNIRLLDTDLQIQSIFRMSVNEIFENLGEKRFRRAERNLCKLIAASAPLIVSTGGGIIKDKANIDALRSNGKIIYIKASPEKIYSNIKNDTSRPLLNGFPDKFQRIKDLMEERKALYESCADITIDSTDLQLEDTVNKISEYILRMDVSEV